MNKILLYVVVQAVVVLTNTSLVLAQPSSFVADNDILHMSFETALEDEKIAKFI